MPSESPAPCSMLTYLPSDSFCKLTMRHYMTEPLHLHSSQHHKCGLCIPSSYMSLADIHHPSKPGGRSDYTWCASFLLELPAQQPDVDCGLNRCAPLARRRRNFSMFDDGTMMISDVKK